METVGVPSAAQRRIFSDPELLQLEERRVLQELLEARASGGGSREKEVQLFEYLMKKFFLLEHFIVDGRFLIKSFYSCTKQHDDLGSAKVEAKLDPRVNVKLDRIESLIQSHGIREFLTRAKFSYRAPGTDKWTYFRIPGA